MSSRLALPVAALVGFIALSYEIVWFRAYSFVSGVSPRAFGVLLGAYLAGIAFGSAWSRRYCRDRAATGDPRTLRFIGIFLLAANAGGFLVVPALATIVTIAHWAWSLLFVCLVAGMFGAVLPLLSHFAIPADDRAGARLSYLYLANILGSAAGSLLTGFVLMDLLPLRGIVVLLTLGGIACSAALLAVGSTGRGRIVAGFAALALGAISWFGAEGVHDALYERLLFKREFNPSERFQHLHENRHGVIAITNEDIVYGGGVYDGAISVDLVKDRNRIVRPFALAAFDRRPREALMVGLSMGSWAQVVVNLPGLERLTIVEINPGYLDLIPLYPELASLLDNPKVEIVIDDGRRWIARHPDRRFDLIVQNTTFHWLAHSTNLLSIEYMEMCRSRLRPGGMLQFNTTSSRHAMRTALEAFPHCLRIGNNMLCSNAALVFDPDRWEKALIAYRIDGRPVLGREDGPRLEELLRQARDRRGGRDGSRGWLESDESLRAWLADVEVITDDNMRSEWHWMGR
jgi:spermidine synthase